MVWGIDIESFIEEISSHNAVVYFHNLKFDGHFIVDWLLKNGYRHFVGEPGRQPKGTFKTLISNMGKWYSFTVMWPDGHVTEFRDSAKKFPAMSVAKLAKSFQLEISKGDIDYHAARPPGYEPTEEELDYLERDVRIVAQSLKFTIEAGMKALTVGADSLAEFKALTGKHSFPRLFPTLDKDMDAEIRRAYRGGFTYADDRFSGRLLGSGIVLDVNSLYPSVMYNNILPYGEPEYVKGHVRPTEKRPLTIFSVTFTAKLKPGHIPCIQIKGSSIFGGTEYLREIKEPTTLVMTNVDFALYQEHYNMTVYAWGGGWRFAAVRGLFDSYIDKWSKIKAESEGGRREIAKLHLNSLYGKFATNPNVTGKVPYLGDDGEVKLRVGPEEFRSPVYTAVGVFVTSYARDLTIRAAQANYGSFAYADTDSLHLLTDTSWGGVWEDPKTGQKTSIPASIDVHPTRMGAWKFEYAFSQAHFIRAKAYLERKPDGQYKVAFAGLPDSVSSTLTFDDIEDGKVLSGKLQPRSVPGGVVLEDVSYTIKL